MGRLAVAGLVVLALVLAFGAVAPATAPVTITSPDSGSMEPTAPEHSLVVVVGDTPTVGDIALYDTPSRTEPVLHRLVETTDGETAFITQGDANQRIDQEAGYPPVTADQIYGTVPTIAGQPLIVPYAGALLTNPFALVGLWAILALSAMYSTSMGKLVRGTVVAMPFRTYAIAIGSLIIVILPLVILATPTATELYVLTSTTGGTDAAYIAAPGETTEREVDITSPLLQFLHVSGHADGELAVSSIETSLGSSTATITVENTPSETPTIHEGTVTMYTYPMTLPETYVHSLAARHPALAAVATSFVLGGPLVVLGLASDPHRVVRASRALIYRTRHTRPRSRNSRDEP